MSGHLRQHSFTGNTDHDFTGLSGNYVPKINSSATGITNSAIYSNDSGNVGIGINSPTSKLHISSIDETSSNFALKTENSTGGTLFNVRNDGLLQINTSTLSYGNLLTIKAKDALNNSLVYRDSTDSFNIFSVKGDGYTTARALNVDAPIYPTINLINSYNTYTIEHGLYDFYIKEGATERLYLASGGNVGIGTTSITARLHIQGIDSTSSNFALKVGNSTGGTIFNIRNDGNVGIGTTATTATLHIKNTTGTTSNTAVFRIDGNAGELFTVVDSLSGSLFSVNDISGLPIIEAFDDSTILMGNYSAPSLNTTKKVNLPTGQTSVYNIIASAYTGGFFDYTLSNTGGVRAGTVMSVWSGTSAQYVDTPASSIGDTSQVTLSVQMSGTNATLMASATTSNWIIKTIIRSI